MEVLLLEELGIVGVSVLMVVLFADLVMALEFSVVVNRLVSSSSRSAIRLSSLSRRFFHDSVSATV